MTKKAGLFVNIGGILYPKLEERRFQKFVDKYAHGKKSTTIGHEFMMEFYPGLIIDEIEKEQNFSVAVMKIMTLFIFEE